MNRIFEFNSHLDFLEIKEKNVSIFNEDNRILIKMKKNSDIITIYFCIRNSLRKTNLIPESIFIITENKNIITKKRKSLNWIKYMSFWEFLDIKEESENAFINDSESKEWKDITGWEIRYKLKPNNEDIKSIINESITEAGEMIEELKKNDK